MRVLVTGSRDWTDGDVVFGALYRARSEGGAGDVVVIHGDCPTGADALANLWAHRRPGVRVERHPADWATHGRRAGFLRNKAMVDAGADVVLAFIKNGSRGASMTARLAEEAGLTVKRYEA